LSEVVVIGLSDGGRQIKRKKPLMASTQKSTGGAEMEFRNVILINTNKQVLITMPTNSDAINF
jgi:hypothetical protein